MQVVQGQLVKPAVCYSDNRHVKNRFTHLLDRSQITSCLESNFFQSSQQSVRYSKHLLESASI